MNLDNLNGKEIFLTGGTGFFGKSILDWLKKGYLPECRFTLLSRNPGDFLAHCPEFAEIKNISFVQGDIRSFPFPEKKFDIVFHGAAPAVIGLPAGEMRSIILDGSKRVLEFAKKCKAERVMFVSSGAVYGRQPADCARVGETFVCAPVTEYGTAKLEAEKMCLSSGVDTVIARCFAFIGPRLNLDIHFAAGNFLRDCLKGEDIVIKGDGTAFRSYLYADDLVEWLFTIISKGRSGGIYNVGSPEAVSIRELAGEIASHFSPLPKIEVLGTAIPGRAPERYVPDVSKAESELGLAVKTSLSEAVELCKIFHLEKIHAPHQSPVEKAGKE